MRTNDVLGPDASARNPDAARHAHPPLIRMVTACPLSTRGGTRLVRLVRGRWGGAWGAGPEHLAARQERGADGGGVGEPDGRRDETCPVSTEGGTRRVQLVRKEGRDVSS